MNYLQIYCGIFFVLIVWLGGKAFASPATPTKAADNPKIWTKAERLDLARDPQWLALLYYGKGWLGSFESFVNSPEFFLAKTGKRDPGAELKAFLSALVSADKTTSEELNPQCRYPARYSWLKSKLDLQTFGITDDDCPKLQSWLEVFSAEKISLVFSSYFLNNPASMMGHTFLRVHRRSDGRKSSPLLDYMIDFAASPTTNNAVLYPLMGMSGFFEGRFSVGRYYLKTQNYGNHEGRDLWEYELSLNQKQVSLILKSVWEMGPHYMNYYYFNRNCSTIILKLLEVGQPDLRLSERFTTFVNPSDTLRAVAHTEGFVTDIKFRPSNRTRFLQRIDRLSIEEASIAKNIIRSKGTTTSIATLNQSPPASEAAILDAILDYIAYQEKLAGERQPVVYASLYESTLARRARLGIAAINTTEIPLNQRPDLGHWTIGVGIESSLVSTGAQTHLLEWRPALHDLSTPDIGYSSELSINLGRTIVSFHRSGLPRIERFELIEILSLNEPKPLAFPLAWQLKAGLFNPTACLWENTACHRYRVKGGIGASHNFFSDAGVLGFLMSIAELSTGGFNVDDVTGGLGLAAGLAWNVSGTQKLTAKSEGHFFETPGHISERHSQLNWSVLWSPAWETKLSVKQWQRQRQLSVTLLHYF